MYCGEDVCLSYVGDFWGECISRTTNTAGAHPFYFGKTKYTSQAVCSSAIQMQNAWCFSVWADSLRCECENAPRVNHAWDIGPGESEKREERCFSFFICLCCVIMTKPWASGCPSQMQLVVSMKWDVPCSRARLLLVAHKPPTPITPSQWRLLRVRSYRLRDA